MDRGGLDRAVAGWWRRFHSVYVWSLSNRRPREIEGGERRSCSRSVEWEVRKTVHVRGRLSGRWKLLQILISY
jgi:hypothetical protein